MRRAGHVKRGHEVSLLLGSTQRLKQTCSPRILALNGEIFCDVTLLLGDDEVQR